MKRLLASILLLVLTVFPAAAQPSTLLFDELRRPEHAVFHITPIGLCEDYPEESTTLDIIRKDMELLARSGVKVLRISFGWDAIEFERDQYDWLFWDDFVRIAVDEYGITLIPYICYTPLWNSTSQDPMEFWRSPPVDYDEFGEFVGDLVNRYKDRIKSWEIWNEPDIEWFWMGDQAQFIRLLEAGSDAVRAADPEAIVVLGGLAHDTEWLRTFLRDRQAHRFVDVINMHNYYETWQDHPMEDLAAYINTVDDHVRRYGEGRPLWLAEVGYSTHRSASRVSDAVRAYYGYEHTPEYQAVDLVRRVTTALSTEKLSLIAWYEIKDLPPNSDTIGDQENNSSLGIANADHSAKPAERAITFINRLYAEPMRSIDREVTTDRTIGSEAVIHLFEQEDGDVLVAGWLRTRVPGRQGDVGAGDRQDGREETVRISIPRALSGEATRYDAEGNGDAFTGAAPDGGMTTVTLTLRGGTVAIVELKK